MLQGSLPFSIEMSANTLVCTASHQSASETGRNVHLVTTLQCKAAGLFLPNHACFSKAEMLNNPCSWSSSEKAVHVVMAHTRSLAEGYHGIYKKTPEIK